MKCQNPCVNACGYNAECHVVSHAPICMCITGYVGDPFTSCSIEPVKDITVESINPCLPSPCGFNAECKVHNNAGSCTCLPEYIGNPYQGCRPQCVVNSDCPSNYACISNKCKNPCPGTCARNAECQVVNHLPTCTCHQGFTGDPFKYCHIIRHERKYIKKFKLKYSTTNLWVICFSSYTYKQKCLQSFPMWTK